MTLGLIHVLHSSQNESQPSMHKHTPMIKIMKQVN